MNEYIIDPMWFYWMDVLAGFDFAFTVSASSISILGLFLGAYFHNDYINMEKEEKSKVIKWVKIWAVMTSTLILLSILIPSKETMIQMQLAKFGTYENVWDVIKAIQDATDYILEHSK